MTNRDIINNYTNEELASYVMNNFIWLCHDCKLQNLCENKDLGIDCYNAIIKWLSEDTNE